METYLFAGITVFLKNAQLFQVFQLIFSFVKVFEKKKFFHRESRGVSHIFSFLKLKRKVYKAAGF